MRVREIKQIKVIQEESAANFEAAYNELMDSLEDEDVRILQTRYRDDQGFCVYIVYEKTVRTPESFEDECKLKGLEYMCGNCPYFYKAEDLGCGHRDCTKVHSRYGVQADFPACDNFFNDLEHRLIKAVRIGEEDEHDEK